MKSKIKNEKQFFCYKCEKYLNTKKVVTLSTNGYLCENCYVEKLKNKGFDNENK